MTPTLSLDAAQRIIAAIISPDALISAMMDGVVGP